MYLMQGGKRLRVRMFFFRQVAKITDRVDACLSCHGCDSYWLELIRVRYHKVYFQSKYYNILNFIDKLLQLVNVQYNQD